LARAFCTGYLLRAGLGGLEGGLGLTRSLSSATCPAAARRVRGLSVHERALVASAWAYCGVKLLFADDIFGDQRLVAFEILVWP